MDQRERERCAFSTCRERYERTRAAFILASVVMAARDGEVWHVANYRWFGRRQR